VDLGGEPVEVGDPFGEDQAVPTPPQSFGDIVGDLPSAGIIGDQIPVDRSDPARCRGVGITGVAEVGGMNAVDARLSPGGGFLYVDESRIGKVGAFAVTGGNLTELLSSPTSLPAGTTPAGIVVTSPLRPRDGGTGRIRGGAQISRGARATDDVAGRAGAVHQRRHHFLVVSR
jgi:hypothetical protein